MQPLLQIETGMHTATIDQTAIDRAGTILVTASEDRTARIWDLATGKLRRVLRPPISGGKDGILNAVALSPNGKTVAVGGWTGFDWDGSNCIYLFDAESGEIGTRITGLTSSPTTLAYSSDGKLLAVSLGGGGIRVFRTDDGTLAMEDSQYSDSTDWVEFDSRDRLVAASRDGDVRLYDSSLHLAFRRSVPGGKQPFSARFSPNGASIAVGFFDTSAIAVIDGQTLAFRYAPDVSGIDMANLSVVAWSATDDRLYAGGRSHQAHDSPTFVWANHGLGVRSYFSSAKDTVMDIRALPTGEMILASGAPYWAVVTPIGTTRLEQTSPTCDYRDQNTGTLATGVQFECVASGQLEDFDIRKLAIATAQLSPGASHSRVTGLPVENWKNNTAPSLGGRRIQLDAHEESRSLAISADATRFLLGGDFWLYLFSSAGHLVWRSPVIGAVWDVNWTLDGRFAVASEADGTIRWYAAENGQERLALLPLPDGQRWIAWTPEGFFAASPGAETLAGYHLNQGTAQASDFVALGQLQERFHRPDLVSAALDPDGPTRIQAALRQAGDARTLLKEGLPPLVKVAKVRRQGNQLVMQIEFTDRGGGVGKPTFRINGVVQESRSAIPSIPGEKAVTVQLRLPTGANVVSIAGATRGGKVQSTPVEVPVDVRKSSVKPTMHVLTVGVSHYLDSGIDLKHAADDALAIASELKARGRGLFAKVNVSKPLLDREVTYTNLEKRFVELASQIKPDDVFVLYIAGHGEVREGRYLFIPANLIYTNGQVLVKDAVDEEKLRSLLAKIPAQKSLVLFDTCSAGAFANGPAFAARSMDQKGALDRLMTATGRAFLAAAGSGEQALEGYQGHGIFTAALLEGLRHADTNKDGFVDVTELDAFVRREVPRITEKLFHQRQNPMSTVTLQGDAFPIAAVSR